MNIILIGFKSSGKSSVGKILSLELNKKFLDTDEILKSLFLKKIFCEKLFFQKFTTQKKTLKIFDIFKFLKEEKFRLLESDAFLSIENSESSVIATGGGSILNEENFQILKKPKIVIYLKGSIETLKKRVQAKKKSIFQDQKLFEETYNLRKEKYENLADITVQTENKDIDQIALEIKNKIGQKKHF